MGGRTSSTGLGTFNSKVVDHSWIYPNYGHGFVDPLTGIVLWARRGDRRARRSSAGDARTRARCSCSVGFLVLWLSFAFLVNKAPNYTRLLVTLPFVAYLVVEALRWATIAGARCGPRRSSSSARSSRRSSR